MMIKNFTKVLLIVSFVLGITGTSMAATTPDLGAAASFGVLASTYSNSSSTSTIINGDLGYTTPPAFTPTLFGTTYIGGGSGNAKYSAGGTAQGAALVALGAGSNAVCDYTFSAGAVNLSTETGHGQIGVYEPGKYCTTATSAASIGTSGIVLSGAGTYIFKMDGALSTTAGSTFTLTNGANACNVFWTPNGDTTIAANSFFIGTVIPVAQDIYVLSTALWTGRALSFGHTVVTPNSNAIITTPTSCTPATATLNVIKSVVGSTALPSDFTVNVYSGGVLYGSNVGSATPGTSYAGLSAGTYTISDVNSSYTQSYSGDCPGGSITLLAGDAKTCTIINTYITPPSGGGGTSLSADVCPNGDYSSGYYDGICGIAPITGTALVLTLVTGDIVHAAAPIVIPNLPKTGIAPEGQGISRNIALLAGIFIIFSISFAAALKKRSL